MHLGPQVDADDDDLVRNSDRFLSKLLVNQVEAQDQYHQDLGCKELPSRADYPTMNCPGKSANGEAKNFRLKSHRVSANAENDGEEYVPPPDELIEDPVTGEISSRPKHASHGCHNPRCSRCGHVWWESDQKNRWRHFCSVFRYALCPHGVICGRECIKPKPAMPREEIGRLKAVFRANLNL